MSVHASVIQLLESQKVQFNVMKLENSSLATPTEEGDNPCLVKSLLLHDSRGRAQVLIPADHILDLDSIFRTSGRRFEALPCDELRTLMDREKLNTLPAIPNWKDLQTYVDSSLTRQRHLLLESGDRGHALAVSHADFANMIQSTRLGDFSKQAPVMSFDKNRDEQQILSSIDKFTERRIRQRLDETLELPPLPETAQRIIKLRADPNADISDLTNIVEIDPSLAAQIVSWAASPYYSAPGKIKSVHDAIVRVLGFDMVLNLALGLSLGKTLSSEALDKNDIDSYWQGAVYSAAVVEGLVTSIDRKHRPGFGMSYLSGLLNNFGFLVLAEIFPPYLNNIKRTARANPHFSSATVAQHLIGVTGNQIAAWLFENWNMPDEVVTALRHQYDLGYQGEHHQYPKLVYLAQQLLAKFGFGGTCVQHIPQSLYQDLYLDEEASLITVQNILESGEDLDAIAEKMRG